MGSNYHQRVGIALNHLKEGLRPFIESKFRAHYRDVWRDKILDALADSRILNSKSDPTADVAMLLRVMERAWGTIFSLELTRAERSLVNELAVVRNRWAHQDSFSLDDAERAIDSIRRLLKAVSAKEADQVERMRNELLRNRYDETIAREATYSPENSVGATTGEQPKPAPRVLISVTPKPSADVPAHARLAVEHGHADHIRKYVLDRIIAPARSIEQVEIIIRAGDVHKAMGLKNALPSVCNVIGGRKFAGQAGVRLLERSGPANGSNAVWRFALIEQATSEAFQPNERAPRQDLQQGNAAVDFSSALVLISCVKSKRPSAAPARDLYTSALFTKCRHLAESHGAPWLLLSAKYGLVAPDDVIEPYEFTLNTLGRADRRAWAEVVLKKLVPMVSGYKRIIFLAGARYREFLIKPLQQRGLIVEAPMEHLTRGEQLSWLSEYE